MNLRSKLDNGLSPKELFIRAVVRPSKLMFLSPVCALMALYMAIVYGGTSSQTHQRQLTLTS